MGITDTIAGWLGYQRTTEALLPDVDPDLGAGYRRVATGTGRLTTDPNRSLPPVTQARAIEISYHLWKTNPLAKHLVEQTLAYVAGKGVGFRCVDQETQDVVDQFVADNELGLRLLDRVRYLLVFGEQFFPLAVAPGGRVRIGYIDPARVSAVVMDPLDVEQVASVEFSAEAGGATTKLEHVRLNRNDPAMEGKLHRVMYERQSPGTTKVLMWDIYRPSNAERGTPYLLAAADWVDSLDQFLVATVDRGLMQAMHAWDVTITGGNPKQCDEYASKFAGIKPGAVRAHNDRIKIEPLSPKLDSSDSSGQVALIKRYAALAAGFPPHWIGEEGSANRSTAEQMGVPTITMLVMLQVMIRERIQQLVDYAVAQAVHAGTLGPRADRTVDVLMPTLWGVDTGSVSSAIQSVTQAMVQATQAGYLTADEAGQVVRYLIGQLGLDLAEVDESTGRRRLSARQVERMIADAEERIRSGQPTPAPAPEPEEEPEPADQAAPDDLTEPQGAEKDPTAALNGAQVKSLMDIVLAVAGGQIPRPTGAALITAAFPLSQEQADQILGTVGAGFVPAAPSSEQVTGTPQTQP